MTDMGRLNTQFQRTSIAATVMGEAVEQLHEKPEQPKDGAELGRYLATVAGLVDPRYAESIDPKLATQVPTNLIGRLGTLTESDAELSEQLVTTANELIAGNPLSAQQIELVARIGDIANSQAQELSREILSR